MAAAWQPQHYTAEQAARILQEVDSASLGDDDEEIQIKDMLMRLMKSQMKMVWKTWVTLVSYTIVMELHICCLHELMWSGSELLACEMLEERLQKMYFHNGLVQHHWHIKQLKLRVL